MDRRISLGRLLTAIEKEVLYFLVINLLVWNDISLYKSITLHSRIVHYLGVAVKQSSNENVYL